MENSFLENIIEKDKEFLIYLNNLGSEQWDSTWMFITNQFSWIPLFAFILFLVFKTFGLKKGIYTILFFALLIIFSDNFTNFVKDSFMRLRPNNEPLVQDKIRYLRHLINPQSYSFWSGHASGSTTFTVFTILLLKPYTKKIYWLFLFPAFFSYSRLYLGVHYPIDIFTGILSGTIIGYLLYKIYTVIIKVLKL